MRRAMVCVVSLLVACSGGDGENNAENNSTNNATNNATNNQTNNTNNSGSDEVCAEQSVVEDQGVSGIVLCERGFDEAPFVRLPADTETVVYAGIDPGDGMLHLRDSERELSERERELFVGEFNGMVGVDASDRYAYALYQVRLDREGVISEVKPYVLIRDDVFLSALRGVRVEGLISKREGEDEFGSRFSLDVTEPVAIEFGEAVELDDEPDGLHGYRIATIGATVVNTGSPTKLDDGSCAPALSELGEEDPFFDAGGESEVVFSRVPNMHGGFDDVLVVEWPESMGGSNMGGRFAGYVSPYQLMRTEPITVDDYASSPHGTPWSAPSLTVTQVDSEGGACE